MLSLECQRVFFLYNKTLVLWGTVDFVFLEISVFPSTSSREILRFSGNKIHCSPRDPPLSVKIYNKI